MQIDYAGKITKDEYLRAMKVVTASTRKPLRWFIGISLLLFLYSLTQLHGRESFGYWLPFMIGTLTFFSFSLYFYFFQPLIEVRRMDHSSNPYRDIVSGYLSPEELVMNSVDQRSSFVWKGFTDYALNQDILILYRTKISFLLFSKAMFASSEDWENCIALVKQKLNYLKK